MMNLMLQMRVQKVVLVYCNSGCENRQIYTGNVAADIEIEAFGDALKKPYY